MNEPENYINPDEEPDMILTQESQFYLQQAGKWAVFVGIVGFVFSGLILFAAVSLPAAFSKMQESGTTMPFTRGMGTAMAFVYGLLGVLGIFFSLHLYQFGSRVKEGILNNDAEITNSSFVKLNAFFKLWGVVTIIFIGFYILVIIATIAGVGMASMGNAAVDVNLK